MVLLKTTEGLKNEKWTNCVYFFLFPEMQGLRHHCSISADKLRIFTLLMWDSEPGTTARGRRDFGEVWFDETTVIFCFPTLLGFVLLENCLEYSPFRQVAREVSRGVAK